MYNYTRSDENQTHCCFNKKILYLLSIIHDVPIPLYYKWLTLLVIISI